ncbi:COP9 signalosome (CSN) subunit [Naganishia albida]|nr:COP9 signalosome (CSN) subunit [Naganishia albida]
MKYADHLRQLAALGQSEDGPALSLHLSHSSKQSAKVLSSLPAHALANPSTLQSQAQQLYIAEPWATIGYQHVCSLVASKTGDHQAAYTSQAQLVSTFLGKVVGGASSWCLPVLYVLLADLRYLAAVADSVNPSATSQGLPCQEDCARTVNRAFSLCATDRINPANTSRRKGVYKIASLSMKCYFKVDRPALCKNLVRATTSDPSIPKLETYPLADQVTWRYYLGYLAFLNGEEASAREHLTWAFEKCHVRAKRNQELILTYLIPLRLLNGTFPSARLLAAYPTLDTLYSPFLTAIRTGSLKAYDTALAAAQHSFSDMACWMTMERVREVCVRTLFKVVWEVSGRTSRIPVPAFKKAMEMQGVELGLQGAQEGEDVSMEEVDALDETECIITAMIYKGYMKGYMSHEKRTVVLAKTAPFPPLSARKQPR